VYRSRRPFAFERLMAVIKKWPIPRKNFDTYLDMIMDASGDAQGLEAAGIASESPLVRVIRSKGFIWLDTQPRQSLFWSHAGRHFSLDQAGKVR
jgi:G3E family GTPase